MAIAYNSLMAIVYYKFNGNRILYFYGNRIQYVLMAITCYILNDNRILYFNDNNITATFTT